MSVAPDDAPPPAKISYAEERQAQHVRAEMLRRERDERSAATLTQLRTEAEAVDAKTARLRALRLARDQGET